MSGSQRIEREVESRVAEILASGGVMEGVVAMSVLFLLPREFTTSYEALYHRALKVDGDRGKEDNWVEVTERVRGEDGKMETRGTGEYERVGGTGKASGARKSGVREGTTLGGMAGAVGGKTYKRAWTVADEKALETKSRVDKRLRKIGREIRTALGEGVGGEGDGGEETRQCVGRSCRKWIQRGWKYCPHCGARNGRKSGSGG